MYNPGIQDRSGEIFGNAIQGAGAALAQGMQAYTKNKEDADMQDGLHRFIAAKVKDDPKAVELFGEDLASYPTMGLSKKKALNAGISAYFADKMQKDDLAQKQAMQDAIIQNYQLGQKRMQQEGIDRDAMMKFVQAYAQPNPIGQGLGPLRPEAMTPDQRAMGALTAAPGAANNPNLDNLLKVLEQQGRGGKNFMPVPFNVGGLQGIVSPLTGQMTVPPVPSEGVQLDPTGKFYFDQRRGWLPTRADATFEPLRNPDGSEVPGMFRLGNKPVDMRTVQEKVVGPEKGASKFGSAEEVRNAMRTGKITREQALKELKAFGYE